MTPTRIFFLLLLLVSVKTFALGQNIFKNNDVFIADFEKDSFKGWDVKRIPQDHSAVIQDEVVRSGNKAVRFELRAGENVSGGFRSELRDPYWAPLFKDTWYTLSFLVPEDFPIEATNSCVFAQWHDQQDPGDGDRNPPLAIRLRSNGTLHITGRYHADKIQNGKPGPELVLYTDPNFKRGEWNDFKVRVFWSYTSTGVVQIWRNGEMIVDYKGPIGYNDAQGPYFKMGVYCRETPVRPLVAFHDNYQRATAEKYFKIKGLK